MTSVRLRASVLLLAAAAVVLGGCATLPPSTERPSVPIPTSSDPNATLVGFYGDSYTLGTGASDQSRRWSSIICAERGWLEFNPSTNGLGFINNRGDLDEPGEVIAAHPRIVFVTMGLNDNFSYDRAADRIHAQIGTDLTRIKAELPDARIIVVEPFWYTDVRPPSVQIIIDWVHAEADTIGADWIPGASHWIEGHPEWMAADGLHPNDQGYAAMAVQMDAALGKLGL